MNDRLVLYGSPHSQFTYKVALMMRLAGEPFSFRYVSFQRGEQKTPEFRRLSRWGQVPVLQHKGQTFCQSAAILEYLSDTLGRFRSPDRLTQYSIRECLFWDADRLAPPVYGCYGVALDERKLLNFPLPAGVAAYHAERARAALGVLDESLTNGAFLSAPEPTIADLCCYGDVAFARLAGIDLGPFPHVLAWAAHIEAMASFAAPLELLPMRDAEIRP